MGEYIYNKKRQTSGPAQIILHSLVFLYYNIFLLKSQTALPAPGFICVQPGPSGKIYARYVAAFNLEKIAYGPVGEKNGAHLRARPDFQAIGRAHLKSPFNFKICVRYPASQNPVALTKGGRLNPCKKPHTVRLTI